MGSCYNNLSTMKFFSRSPSPCCLYLTPRKVARANGGKVERVEREDHLKKDLQKRWHFHLKKLGMAKIKPCVLIPRCLELFVLLAQTWEPRWRQLWLNALEERRSQQGGQVTQRFLK